MKKVPWAGHQREQWTSITLSKPRFSQRPIIVVLSAKEAEIQKCPLEDCRVRTLKQDVLGKQKHG